MTTYDSSIMQEFADRLYSRATGTIFVYGILGAIIGVAFGAFFMDAAHVRDAEWLPWASLVFGLMVGILIGREKAFHLKLEAQRTLCQLQIERNTRKAESAHV